MKILITILLGIVLISSSIGQSDLSFYHLRDRTPQSMMHNASFFPDAEFYLSLPGVSGLNVKFNNGFTYEQLMVPIEGTDSVKVDLESALNNLKEGDNLRIRGDVSLFQFGIRAGNKTFSLFSNLRYGGGLVYPVQFLNYFVEGNGNFIGERVEEKSLRGGGIAYREIGLGYAQEFLAFDERQLRVGARVKYLHGLAHASSDPDASVSMLTESDTYDLTVRFNNATFRTAGFNDLQDDPASYAIGFGSNKNTGYAIDLGAQLAINDRLNGYLSINDLGFINWKQDIENHTLTDSEVLFNGFDELDKIDLTEAFEDSLDTWSDTESTSASFRTAVGERIILGADYQVLNNGTVSGTLMRTNSSYGAAVMGFGVGYTHQFGSILTLSTTVSKDQYQPIRAGGAFIFRIGLLQFYAASDDLLNLSRDPAGTNGMNVRVGLNFLVGRSFTGNKQLKKKEELSPFPPEYDLDHLVDEEGDGSGF